MQVSPVASLADKPDAREAIDSEFQWHTRELPESTANLAVSRQFSNEVLPGLCQTSKAVSAVWRYDAEGLVLAGRVHAQPEYYLARKEAEILRMNRPILRELLCRTTGVVEIGNGRSATTSHLLDAMDRPQSYLPINLSAEALEQSVAMVRNCFPEVGCLPHHADYRQTLALAAGARGQHGLVAYCPGSVLGGLMPLEAVVCMQRISQWVGRAGLLIVGQDITCAPQALLAAYDDAQGAMAALDRNVLSRINRELGGSFDLDTFRHEARFNPRLARVETHLVSTIPQWVEVSDRAVHFEAGESIHTESAYKYPAEEFVAMASSAGWHRLHTWTDRDRRFAVHVFSASQYAH